MTVDQCHVDRDKNCNLKRGDTYFMNMNFTPDFDGSDIEMLAWTKIASVDTRFEGMEKDACKFMTCPITSGIKQDYLFNLKIKNTFPRGSFKVQWRMSQDGEVKCCFQNLFKLI